MLALLCDRAEERLQGQRVSGLIVQRESCLICRQGRHAAEEETLTLYGSSLECPPPSCCSDCREPRPASASMLRCRPTGAGVMFSPDASAPGRVSTRLTFRSCSPFQMTFDMPSASLPVLLSRYCRTLACCSAPCRSARPGLEDWLTRAPCRCCCCRCLLHSASLRPPGAVVTTPLALAAEAPDRRSTNASSLAGTRAAMSTS